MISETLGLAWEREFQEQISRQSVQRTRQHQHDRYHEKCQQLQRELSSCKKNLQRLQTENESLRGENKLLLKELQTRETMLQSSAPTALKNSSVSSLKYASFMLPKFNGSNPKNYAEMWLKTIVRNAGIFSWTEAQTLVAAKLSLEGPARQWLLTRGQGLVTWKDFKAAFRAKFHWKTVEDKILAEAIHLTLAKKRKEGNNDVGTYVKEILDLGLAIDLDEGTLMEYVINGLACDEVLKDELRQIPSFEGLHKRLKYLEEMKISVHKESGIEDSHDSSKRFDKLKTYSYSSESASDIFVVNDTGFRSGVHCDSDEIGTAYASRYAKQKGDISVYAVMIILAILLGML